MSVPSRFHWYEEGVPSWDAGLEGKFGPRSDRTRLRLALDRYSCHERKTNPETLTSGRKLIMYDESKKSDPSPGHRGSSTGPDSAHDGVDDQTLEGDEARDAVADDTEPDTGGGNATPDDESGNSGGSGSYEGGSKGDAGNGGY